MVMISAFLWGFGEATFFFIIPDVLLSWYALRTENFRKVFTMNIVCIAGAAIGGAAIFMMSTASHEAVLDFMLSVPAIHSYMLAHVEREMAAGPFHALITGPLFGVPYKLFAALAPHYTTLSTFILFSVPARFIRFILVSSLAFFLSHRVFPGMPGKVKTSLWLMVWVMVYAVYFSIHPF